MKVLAIAVNTFRETIREKVLYNLLIFALIIIGASVLLQNLTFAEQVKIVKDMCLASISVFGVIMSIFIGITLVSREIERRSIYATLAKPLHRHQFLLGKYIGLLMVLAVNVLIMTAGMGIVVYAIEGPMGSIMYWAVFFTFLELCLVTAIALLFSTFTTTTLSATFTLALFVIGRMSGDIKYFGGRSASAFVRKASEVLYYVLPNLQNYNIRSQAVYNDPVPFTYILWVTAGCVLYSAALLLLASLIFQKRDFK